MMSKSGLLKLFNEARIPFILKKCFITFKIAQNSTLREDMLILCKS